MRYRIVSEDYSVAGTVDQIVVPDLCDLTAAARLAAGMSGPLSRAWVEDDKGRRLYEAGPVRAVQQARKPGERATAHVRHLGRSHVHKRPSPASHH